MSNSCFSFKLPQLNNLSLRRGNSRSSLQSPSPENPYCVVIDFSAVTEKECGKLDTINEKKYQKLISKANKAEKTIQRTGLSMNLEVPPPPHPSNRDRFIIWKKRNVSRKVIPQSEAIVFLTQNNLILNQDYEAYQAIDLANEMKKEKRIPLHNNDSTHNFDNVYNQHDKNILRRRSMYRTNKHLKPNEVQSPPDYPVTQRPLHNHPQPQPLPLPPPPQSVYLRNTQPLPNVNSNNQPLPNFNNGSGFYPSLNNIPHENPITPSAPSAPSAPPIPSSPPLAPIKNNNIQFTVSCSTHDEENDGFF